MIHDIAVQFSSTLLCYRYCYFSLDKVLRGANILNLSYAEGILLLYFFVLLLFTFLLISLSACAKFCNI